MWKIAIVAFALSAVACGGKKSSSGLAVSCNDTTNAFCWSASGPAAAMTSGGYTAADCAAQPATAVASCSTTGRVGRCSGSDAQPAGAVQLTLSFYAPWDATTAASQCATLGGTWTPG